MKQKNKKLIPLLGRAIVPGAAVASGLFSPFAAAAPGDLDPAFGDLGRLGPILNGPAWSVEPLDDGTMLLGGGDFGPFCTGWYCYYYYSYYDGFYASNFVNGLTDTGLIDPGFSAPSLSNTQVLDIVRQPSGEVVAVGRKASRTSSDSLLTVFRLQADGPLDPAFGTDGIFELSADDYGVSHWGSSIVLDANGRIVVAGSRNNELIVLRLLPDGSLDDTFGTAGVFIGPENSDRAKLLATAAGGYRVSLTNSAGCQLVALTADGALDSAFGNSGVSTVDTPSGPSDYCSSMVTQPDGRLLLAGSAAGQGFATRLLADGQTDPGFSATAVSDAMADATALALGDDGSIVVADAGVNGASVMRLQANGMLDAEYGNAGSTLIDLPSDDGSSPVVHEMIVQPDGSVVAVGGDEYSGQAFVTRLLGASGGDSPGVIGVTQQSVITTSEGAGEIVVNVRRTGGFSGIVSAAYQTISNFSTRAIAGQDYGEVAGRLSWGDGDATVQEIRVPILAGGLTEEHEYFSVRLSDTQGGAGLGTRNANVQIDPDGSPFGQFEVSGGTLTVTESDSVEVWVYRNYYSTGAVSVTLAPVGVSATPGVDFDPLPVTLSWADGESGGQTAVITIRNDTTNESNETITVQLSNPTGGALIGPRSTATIIIEDNDPPARKGGGALGYLSLLLLGGFKWLRFALRSRQAPPSS